MGAREARRPLVVICRTLYGGQSKAHVGQLVQTKLNREMWLPLVRNRSPGSQEDVLKTEVDSLSAENAIRAALLTYLFVLFEFRSFLPVRTIAGSGRVIGPL